MTLTNIAQRSHLLWIHAVVCYLVAIVVMRVSLSASELGTFKTFCSLTLLKNQKASFSLESAHKINLQRLVT